MGIKKLMGRRPLMNPILYPPVDMEGTDLAGEQRWQHSSERGSPPSPWGASWTDLSQRGKCFSSSTWIRPRRPWELLVPPVCVRVCMLFALITYLENDPAGWKHIFLQGAWTAHKASLQLSADSEACWRSPESEAAGRMSTHPPPPRPTLTPRWYLSAPSRLQEMCTWVMTYLRWQAGGRRNGDGTFGRKDEFPWMGGPGNLDFLRTTALTARPFHGVFNFLIVLNLLNYGGPHVSSLWRGQIFLNLFSLFLSSRTTGWW